MAEEMTSTERFQHLNADEALALAKDKARWLADKSLSPSPYCITDLEDIAFVKQLCAEVVVLTEIYVTRR